MAPPQTTSVPRMKRADGSIATGVPQPESPNLGPRPSLGQLERISTNKLTLRIPEACHGPAGMADHAHEVSIKACLVPKELYEHIVEAGVTKSKWRLDKQIIMGLLAGMYIGFSYTLMMVIGGQIPEIQHGPNPGLYNYLLGAVGFPLGLFMIVVVGADLFTSNCSYMVTALHEGRISFFALLKNWVLSWWINLAGSIIMAQIVYSAEIFKGRDEFVLYLAQKKAGYSFSVCLCKGILANWLVNLAVWIANAAQDVTGKFIGIFIPISAFISIGGEHCIANQFLMTLAKLHGLDMSVGYIVGHNLVPSTIGNTIGGFFFVGTLYSMATGTLLDTIYDRVGQAWRKVTGKSSDAQADSLGMRRSGDHTWYEKALHAVVSPHWLHWGHHDQDLEVAAVATHIVQPNGYHFPKGGVIVKDTALPHGSGSSMGHDTNSISIKVDPASNANAAPADADLGRFHSAQSFHTGNTPAGSTGQGAH